MRKAGRPCPARHAALLDSIESHGSRAEVCLKCGGLWFEAGELSRAIRAHDPEAVPPLKLADTVGKPVGRSGNHCPNCDQSLRVHHVSDQNPHKVEICRLCSGVWLPRGDLAKAQAGHQIEEAREKLDTETTWGHWFFQFLSGLPVEFNIEPRRPPVATFTIMFFNGLIFYAMSYWPPFAEAAVRMYALYPDRFGEPQWFLSLVTSMFLHGGLIHLLGNMYFLWLVGDNIEDVLGSIRYLVFYILAGVAGGVLFTLVSLDVSTPTVGASGAISGLVALYAIVYRRSRLTFMLIFWQYKMGAPFYVGIWFIFNVGGWLVDSPGVAWAAHLGGFGFGAIFGLAAYRTLLRRRPLLRLLNREARK